MSARRGAQSGPMGMPIILSALKLIFCSRSKSMTNTLTFIASALSGNHLFYIMITVVELQHLKM